MTRTREAVFTVSNTDLDTTEFLVPKDLSGEADQVRVGDGHRSWVAKLVAGPNTDADVELEAAVTTGDDADFSEYIKEGTADTALNGAANDVPDTVAAVFSDEALGAGINAALTPQTDPTAGDYKVVIESGEY